MLLISRKKNESIVIDNQIEITVLEISGSKARLSINAPKAVTVHRKEIQDAINNQAIKDVSAASQPQEATGPDGKGTSIKDETPQSFEDLTCMDCDEMLDELGIRK